MSKNVHVNLPNQGWKLTSEFPEIYKTESDNYQSLELPSAVGKRSWPAEKIKGSLMMFTRPVSKMGHFQHTETEMRKSSNAQGTEGKGWGEKKTVKRTSEQPGVGRSEGQKRVMMCDTTALLTSTGVHMNMFSPKKVPQGTVKTWRLLSVHANTTCPGSWGPIFPIGILECCGALEHCRVSTH